MKRFPTIVAVLLVAGACIAAPPENMTVSTNSIKILPERATRNAADFATNTAYAQGRIVKNAGMYYMAVDGGTSGATAPTHFQGDASDGTVTWRKIEKGKRSGYAIVNDSTNAIYVALGFPAVVNTGIRLNLGGGSLSDTGDDIWQGAIYAVGGGGTNLNVTVQEWRPN